MIQPLWKTVQRLLKKPKIELPYDPAIPLLNICPKEMKSLLKKIFVLLCCTPQAYKSCICTASRPKKEPRVSNRDVNSLMDGIAYTSEARPWSDTPLCAAGHDGSLHSRGEEEITSIGELASGVLIS